MASSCNAIVVIYSPFSGNAIVVIYNPIISPSLTKPCLPKLYLLPCSPLPPTKDIIFCTWDFWDQPSPLKLAHHSPCFLDALQTLLTYFLLWSAHFICHQICLKKKFAKGFFLFTSLFLYHTQNIPHIMVKPKVLSKYLSNVITWFLQHIINSP